MTTVELPLFGTAFIDDSNYLSHGRAFVQFLLDHPFYEDSLPIFHPNVPKGAVTVEDRAFSHFLLYMYTPHGQEVKDKNVSRPY